MSWLSLGNSFVVIEVIAVSDWEEDEEAEGVIISSFLIVCSKLELSCLLKPFFFSEFLTLYRPVRYHVYSYVSSALCMRYLLFLCLCSPLVAFSARELLKPRDPAWQTELLSTYENGQSHHLLLVGSDKKPQKLLEYHRNGQLKRETDLSKDGSKEGYELVFYDNGKIEQFALYKKGVLHGPFCRFLPLGIPTEEIDYINGLPHGEAVYYHANGKVKSRVPYLKGLLHGEKREWSENGELASITPYVQGMIHGVKEEFLPEQEEKKSRFCFGLRHGYEVTITIDGKEKRVCSYKRGKKNGKEIEFSSDHTPLLRGSWNEGMPVGDHIEQYDRDHVAKMAVYDNEGHLTGGPIRTFSRNGVLLKEENIDKGWLKEYFSSGELSRELSFSKEGFDGFQREFYPSGQLALEVHFQSGKKNGAYKEWYGDGSKKCSYTYLQGMKEGLCESWYSSGQEKSRAQYSRGLPEGSVHSYYANGVLQEEMQYKNGLLEGELCVYAEDGTLLAQESYEAGRPTKDALLYYPNKQLKEERHYIGYKPEGVWKRYFENGAILQEAFYKEGLPEGEWREFYPLERGEKRQILKVLENFKSGLLDGEQKQFARNGQLQVVIGYEDGVFHGRKALFDESGKKVFEAFYKKGKLEGKQLEISEDGFEQIKYYKDNVLHGDHFIYWPSNMLSRRCKAYESHYENGLLQGEVIEYTQSGKKKVVYTYKDNKREGPALFYDDQGYIEMEAAFKEGKQHGPMRHFFTNGKVQKELYYIDDLQHGDEITYFRDGRIASIRSYKEGKLDGISREYNKKGLLLFEAEYKNGARNGVWKKYDEEGDLLVNKTFMNDREVARKK